MSLDVNKKDYDGLVNTVSKGIKKELSGGLARAMDQIGILAIGKHIINPGGESKAVHSTKITTRSGRTVRSLLPQGGAFSAGGEKEQIRQITAQGDRIEGLFGTKAPGGVHETGAKISKTAKQKAFFWAKWYESGQTDTKWKALALSKSAFIVLPKRPFLAPAIDQGLNSIYDILSKSVAALLR